MVSKADGRKAVVQIVSEDRDALVTLRNAAALRPAWSRKSRYRSTLRPDSAYAAAPAVARRPFPGRGMRRRCGE